MSFLFAIEGGNGTPSVSQILSYVLRLMASDRQWCLYGIRIILLVRLVALLSNRSLDVVSLLKVYHFFMGRGAR
jgi:hypothetical protein